MCFWRGFRYIRSAAHLGLAAGCCRSRMVAGSLHIGKMSGFEFVIVHVCQMCAKSRSVSHRRHFMHRV